MLEAAERGALLRCRGGIERIDFHHIAGTVGLIGMLRNIEAPIVLAPVVAPILGLNAVACLLGRDLVVGVGGREVTVEVFFARQVRAPRRPAIAAVVPGSFSFLLFPLKIIPTYSFYLFCSFFFPLTFPSFPTNTRMQLSFYIFLFSSILFPSSSFLISIPGLISLSLHLVSLCFSIHHLY